MYFFFRYPTFLWPGVYFERELSEDNAACRKRDVDEIWKLYLTYFNSHVHFSNLKRSC